MAYATLVSVILGGGALAFGSADPWAYVPLVSAATIAGGVGLLRRSGARTLPPAVVVALVLVGLALAVQLVPIPRPLLAGWFPATHDLLVQLEPAYAAGAASHPLSVRPAATVTALACYFGFALLFTGTSGWLARTPGGARRLTAGIAIVGGALALVGIVQRGTFNGRLLWVLVPENWDPAVSVPFGPFTSRNHFAGWMLMALPLVLGGFVGRSITSLRRAGATMRDRLAGLGSSSFAGAAMMAGAAAVMALALVLTLSRSGIAGLVVIVALFAAALMTRTAGMIRALTVATLLAVLVASLAQAGTAPMLQRFSETDDSLGKRGAIWKVATDRASRYWITGTGVNTFDVLTAADARNLPGHYAQAHNDYLQLAAEGGLLVGIPVLALLAAVTATIRRRVRESALRGDESGRWLRFGAVVGLIAIALQAGVDFSLHLPGNAALFAVLLAVATHQTPPRGAARRSSSPASVPLITPVRTEAMPSAARHIVLVIALTTAVAAPATAQSNADDPVERARIQLGPLGITPTLGVMNVGIDTNVFNETANPKRDLVMVSTAGADAWLRLGRTRLTLDGRGDLVYFRDFAGERGVDGTFGGVYEVLGSRVTPWVGARLNSARQRTGYEIDARARRHETRLSAGFDVRLLSRSKVTVAAQRTDHDYEAGAAFLGTSLREALSRRSETATVTFSHQVTPLTTFVVQGAVVRDRFVHAQERDTDSRRFAAGFDLAPVALISGTGRVGYRTFSGQPAVPRFAGPVASIDVAYTLLGRARFELAAQRDLEYSFDRAYPYYVLTGTRVAITPQLSSQWDLQARISRQQLAYADTGLAAVAGRTDRYTLYGAGLGYRLGSIRIGANVDRERRDSPLPNHRYDGLKMGLSMTYGR
jgi:O-antigen ligase